MSYDISFGTEEIVMKSPIRRYIHRVSSEQAVFLNMLEHNRLIEQSINQARKWVDNGLRVCSKIIGVPKDFRERGKALENELGRILDSCEIEKYGLPVPVGKYQIADAVVKLKSRLFLRIEAKSISSEYSTIGYKCKYILEWSNKGREKPDIFVPYSLLYLNYDYYKSLTKEEFR